MTYTGVMWKLEPSCTHTTITDHLYSYINLFKKTENVYSTKIHLLFVEMHYEKSTIFMQMVNNKPHPPTHPTQTEKNQNHSESENKLWNAAMTQEKLKLTSNNFTANYTDIGTSLCGQ